MLMNGAQGTSTGVIFNLANDFLAVKWNVYVKRASERPSGCYHIRMLHSKSFVLMCVYERTVICTNINGQHWRQRQRKASTFHTQPLDQLQNINLANW